MGQGERHDLGWLAANLACRGRLGLGRVAGGPEELSRLLELLGAAQAGEAAKGEAASPPSGGAPGGSLEDVRTWLGQCTRCGLAQGRNKIVFGRGGEQARLLIIGEAPGAQEDKRGLPFVGPAGQLLDRMLLAVGLGPDDFYITNIVKCRPPGNRDPRPEEARACRSCLEAQAGVIAPQAILTLGRPAAQAVLGTDAPITALRGNWREGLGAPLLPTFHPAFLLRSPEKKALAYADLKAVARRLGLW